jgi:hypothetical protein
MEKFAYVPEFNPESVNAFEEMVIGLEVGTPFKV